MNNRISFVSEEASVVEASRNLSIEEQQVLNLIVSRVSPEDKDGQSYAFSISEVDELISNECKAIDAETRVQAMTREFMKKGIQIKRNKHTISIGWLSSVEYNSVQGKIAFSFNPYLKPYFLALKQHILRRPI